jgi:prepilin-type N-terminal cleavage/methylation domain-containing protein
MIIKSELCRGYSFLELLLAMVVSSVILAACYASYTMVSNEYNRISAFAETQENGVAVLQLISRDLRMAGYKALNASMNSPFGKITTPIAITDSGNMCCDSVKIIYDKSTILRQRVSYYTLPRVGPARNALYMDVETWDGATWTLVTSQSLVTDYIEDFQLLGSQLNSDGNPAMIDLSIVMRSKTPLSKAVTYSKPTYDTGNYTLNTNDIFHRDNFSGTINIRNLR